MIVVDTNVLASLAIPAEAREEADLVYGKDPTWVAPLLWRSEFRNVLVKYLRKAPASLPDALTWLESAESALGGRDFPVPSRRVLELAAESGCTAYDCEFVALAEELGVPLVTWDRAVLDAFPKVAVEPEVFCR